MIDLTRDWRELLTEGERNRMLDDIARVCLALGSSLAGEEFGTELSDNTRESLAERLLFLEWMLPQLAPLIDSLDRQYPSQQTQSARRVTPSARARRVTTAAILEMARAGSLESSILETVSHWSYDTPENRIVKSFLETVIRETQAVTRQISEEGYRDFAERSQACLRATRAWPHQRWFAETQTTSSLASPTQKMLSHPIYAAIRRWITRYQQSFRFEWTHPLLQLSQRETWQIYEAWGLFTTLEVLLSLGYIPLAHSTDDPHALIRIQRRRATFRLEKGMESAIPLRASDGHTLCVTYNRAFLENTASLSHTMVPDITLEKCDGNGTKLWVLDPKFKTYALPGSEGEDINQMHAYRDAVIDLHGHPVIKRAWCLYAGQVGVLNRSVISYGARDKSIVGAVCLRPGDKAGFQTLRSLLSGWLN